MSWRDRAGCLGREWPPYDLPDMSVAERRKVARWYCLECPVVRECARDALDGGDVSVIRAGLWLAPASTRQSRSTRAALGRACRGRPWVRRGVAGTRRCWSR